LADGAVTRTLADQAKWQNRARTEEGGRLSKAIPGNGGDPGKFKIAGEANGCPGALAAGDGFARDA